ncbi:MAG: glycosyltransferase family 4 protein [Pseudonocardiales bacterium]|nr:glycosyltransferase family 4 protein [Pseudonocardiales bacterium]
MWLLLGGSGIFCAGAPVGISHEARIVTWTRYRPATVGACVRVLGFGTYDLGRHPRAGVMLDGLRAHGDDVIEVNEPLGFSTAERVAMLGKPWLAYRLALRLLARWAHLARRALRARRRGAFDTVVVGYLGHFDVLLARILFPRTRIVLDLLIFAADTARDRRAAGGLKLRLLDTLDRLAVRCADVIALDTDEHLRLLPERSRYKGVVVLVGAPAAWFAAGDAPSDPTAAALRVVFFGLYTPLQGATVIGEALALLADRPEIEVTMIGNGQDFERARATAAGNRSVTWREWVEPTALPGIVAAHDVCLGIFGTSAKAQRVVPNKVYQGAAAGCAIITSDTRPQRRVLGDAALYVAPGDPAALADALRSLAADPPRTKELRAAARTTAAERFTASAIVEPLREHLSH